jgi:hypothetical protein
MKQTTVPKPTLLARLVSHRLLILTVSAIALSFIGLGTVAASRTNGHTLLELATTRQPDDLTELSFNAPAYLPKDMEAGKLLGFSYNVSNRASTARQYRAVVTIIENGRAHTLEQDTITVPPGSSKNTSVHFTETQPGTDVEFIVSLPDQNLLIHFRGKS